MDHYERIVVGMGAVGVSTLRHLSEEFDNVLGIDKGSVPNPDATSYGLTRLIQFTSYTDYSYIPILRDAVKQWKKLEESSDGRRIFYDNGTLEICERGSDAMSETIDFFREAGIDYEFLSSSEINERYSLFQLDDRFSAIRTDVGGLLDARNCIEMQRRIAVGNGASVNTYEPIQSIEQQKDGVKLRTDSEDYKADEVVVSLGAWTGSMFPKIGDELTVKNHSYSHFLNGGYNLRDNYPAFLVRQNDKPSYYGLVEPSKNAVKYGVGSDEDESLIRQPPTQFTRGINKDNNNYEIKAADNHFGINTSETNRDSCMISYSPDHHPIIDYHPDYDDIIVATGMSGHGFKFSNITGTIIKDMSVKNDTKYDIQKFSVDRLDI